MDVDEAKQVIKTNINMTDIAKYYGYEIKGKRINCPFHKDTKYDLKLREWSFKCFSGSCDKFGNVIDFIMLQENLSFIGAIEFLNGAFGLGIDFDIPPTRFEVVKGNVRKLTRRLGEIAQQGKEAVIYNKIVGLCDLPAMDIEFIRGEYKKVSKELKQNKELLFSGCFDREIEVFTELEGNRKCQTLVR